MSLGLIIGALAAAGTYMVLQRGIARIALGFVLLGHAVNILLIASGGTARRDPAFGEATAATADPLPQAFALTAIVISFAVTAFLLALAYRSAGWAEDDDPEEGG